MDRDRGGPPCLPVVLAPGHTSRAEAHLPVRSCVPATHIPDDGGPCGEGPGERKRPEPVNADRLLDAPRAPLLSVRGISCSFGGVRAVADVSFLAPAGQITGLIGPNGAGKSTTLGIVAGFIRPSAGTIQFAGRDITKLPNHRRARLGMIRTFQMRGEFDRLTVLENLLVAAPGQ